MKILAGIEQPSAGKLYLDGKEVRFPNTRVAGAAGIGIIHQELNMFREMRVADNMFAGNEIARFGVIDRRSAAQARARSTLAPTAGRRSGRKMMNLRVGQQQIIEIGKTMLKQKLRVLIMDEPTSSLSNAEVEVLFKLIEDLRSQGVAIIYISHRLEEIMRVCDRVTILRDGRRIDSAFVRDMRSTGSLSAWSATHSSHRKKALSGHAGARCWKSSTTSCPGWGGGYTVDHVSFTLHRGEVLGIYGLMGAGRTELVESLMGLHPEASGEMVLDGKRITHPVVSEQIARGMVLVPEDRQKDGLVQCMSIFNNMRLTVLKRLSTHGVMREKDSRREVAETVQDLQVKVADVNQLVTALFGRQPAEVVIGKCVMARAKVFQSLDEPSRGIDVGAKTDIFNLMRGFAAHGHGRAYSSAASSRRSCSVCDRVLVMSNGKVTADHERRGDQGRRSGKGLGRQSAHRQERQGRRTDNGRQDCQNNSLGMILLKGSTFIALIILVIFFSFCAPDTSLRQTPSC